jgi:hypothetical protein
LWWLKGRDRPSPVSPLLTHMKNFGLLLLIGLYSILFTSCFLRNMGTESDTASSVYLSANEIPQGTVGETETTTDPPQNKVVMSNLGRGIQEVELELFTAEGVPLALYLPAGEFQVETAAEAAGQAVYLHYQPQGQRRENIYIQLLFPHESANLEAVQTLVMGEGGLLDPAQWAIVDRTSVVAYSWVEEKFVYRPVTAEMPLQGMVLIGRNLATADEQDFFTVMMHYPVGQSNDFEARSTLILDNIEFYDR